MKPLLKLFLLLSTLGLLSHVEAKPAAKSKPKPQAQPVAPAGDGADEEYSAPPSPPKPKAKTNKPKSLEDASLKTGPVTSTPAAPDAAFNPDAAPRPVTINATTRNASTSKATAKLAQDGKALMPIAIAADAGERVKFAANDLARILEKITGAKFEVQQGDGKSGIVIGTTAQFPHPELEPALKRYTSSAENIEAFAIRTSANRVLLLANTDMGAGDAVYRFLNELGYRQLMPNPNWEVFPESTPDLSWNRDITDRPEIISRNIWAGQPPRVSNNWNIRNNHNMGIGINAGHNYSIPGWNKDLWKPEYWALIGGVRKEGTQIDFGTPGAMEYIAQYALSQFRANPKLDMVSVGPRDDGSWSQSEEFKKLGTVSDAVFGMANYVARAVAKEFPGKLVGVYAYREYGDPPSFKLEPNVYVQITPALFLAPGRTKDVYQEWGEKASNVGRYDYYQVYQWSMDSLPGANVANKSYLTPRIANYVAQNATSIDGESSNTSWFLHGHGFYIANKLMWNSSLDYDELKTDFLQNAFGPAYEPMRDFYELRNWENHYIISKNLISDMVRDMVKAESLAKNRPDVLARLDDFKLYMRFAELGSKASALPVNKPETYDAHAAALGAFYKHIMRSASAGMMETYLAQQMLYRATIGGIDLKKNPELQPGVKDSVWSGTPYTKAEIDNFWKETVAYYNAPSVEMKDYDLSDLVPVEWKNVTLVGMEDDKMPWVITQGGSAAYGMYSLRGEPLKVQLKWNYPGPRNWTLKDKTDTVVLKGTAFTEKDSNNETIELKVPKSGYYFFEAVDTGGWLTVTVLGNQIASSDMKRNGWPGKYGGTVPTFFYVPKDLKNLSIYSGAALLKLLGPDGKVVFEKPDAAGEWTIVPVPAGLDGTVWQFAAGFSASALGNAPRIMATSPSRLMIPRNVAEKDGLTIRR